MKIRMVAGLVVLGVLLGIGGMLSMQELMDGGGDSIPEAQRLSESWLQGVNLNDLAEEGIYLSQPPLDYLPKFSSGAAKAAAGKRFSNVAARQVLLAHVETENMGGFNGQAWIINFDPTDGDLPEICPGSKPIYVLAFVDAERRIRLFTESRGTPSSGCGPARTRVTPLDPTPNP